MFSKISRFANQVGIVADVHSVSVSLVIVGKHQKQFLFCLLKYQYRHQTQVKGIRHLQCQKYIVLKLFCAIKNIVYSINSPKVIINLYRWQRDSIIKIDMKGFSADDIKVDAKISCYIEETGCNFYCLAFLLLII